MSTKDFHDEVALARYAVIAPLVRRKMEPAAFHEEARRIAAAWHRFPGEVVKRVSLRNLRRWVKWYKEGRSLEDGRHLPPGLEALQPLVREDRGVPRVLSPELIERAIRLRAEEPARNTAALVKLLAAEAVARGEEPPAVEEATLAYHLRARRATRRIMKREGRVYPRYEHAHRNDLWQGDMTGGLWLPNPLDPSKPRQCFLHAVIDDRTRFVPHAEFYFRQNLTCLLHGLRIAVNAGGVPSVFFVDQGSAYQHHQLKRMAARLTIEVVHATEYHPEGKGKIERFFRTVKDGFYPEARRAGLRTLEELNEFFWGWLEQYHDTEHSETKATPRTRWDAEAELARWPEPAQMAEAFLWEEVRKVDRTGCVSLDGNSYAVPEHLVGQRVALRFDPFELSQVRVYHQEVYVDTVSPQKLTSNTFRKALPRRIEKPAPLESAVAYRKQMSRSYRKRLQAVIDTSTPLAREPGTDCLTGSEFVALLSTQLGGRQLTDAESHQAADFFLRHAPLLRHRVERALQMAVEEKGRGRHLRFYLDAVRSTRQNPKGGA